MKGLRDAAAALSAVLSLVIAAAYLLSLFSEPPHDPLSLALFGLDELALAVLFAAVPIARRVASRRLAVDWDLPMLWTATVGSVLQAIVFAAAFSPFFVIPLAAAFVGVIAAVAALVVSPQRAHGLFRSLLATPAPVAILLAMLIIAGEVGAPERYETPSGYHGWVSIAFGRPLCPKLPREGIEVVITADARGCGCTSDPPSSAITVRRYFAVRSDGTKTELSQTSWGGGGSIWGEYSGTSQESGSSPRPIAGYFVGTESEIQGGWRGPTSVQQDESCRPP